MSRIPAALTGQHLEPEEGDDQCDRPEGAGEDQPRVEELDGDPEHAEREKQHDDVRVDEGVEDPLPERHVDRRDIRARCVEDEALRLRLHAVDVVQEGGQVGRDHVDDVLVERLLRGQVGGLADRLLGPVGVPSVCLGEPANVGGRVVDHLAAQIARDVAAARRDRGRGADVGLRRHCGDVGGHRDEDACRGCARALRRDVDDDRDRRVELLLDDVPHGRVEAAGRVHEDDDRVVALVLALVDRAGEVVRGDRVDVVLELDRENARRIRSGGRSGESQGGREGAEKRQETPQEQHLRV